LSWLFPRAARWILHRNGIKGQAGQTLLEVEASDEDDEEGEDGENQAEPQDQGIGARDLPSRRIYCLDLRTPGKAPDYVTEIQRISAESSVQTVGLGSGLMGFIAGSPKPEQLQRYLQPGPGNVAAASGTGQSSPLAPREEIISRSEMTTLTGQAGVGLPSAAGSNAEASSLEPVPATDGLTPAARLESFPENGNGDPALNTPHAPLRIEEDTDRRWYPVIDFSRCTNCLECLDFCLFGVYGIDRAESILVEQPDNCRKGCPACSRVCPANAIIFPQHKSPAIAGSPEKSDGAFKIDLSKLFGAPEGDPLQTAVRERDEQLLLSGREAVGMAVGIPKRQTDKPQGPKDDLDALMDKLDALEL
jgi:NAD-dependent dihydropyrimidine dehydrogenase PreA subunit